jgi:hypothetical protein
VLNQTVCVNEAGKDILSLEPGVTFQQRFEIVACREHSEYVLDGEATTAHDRLSAEYLWVDRDALEKLVVSH